MRSKRAVLLLATALLCFEARAAAPVATLPPADPRTQQPPQELTLEKSVAMAIQNATSVQKAVENDELSATQLMQSYAQFLPNLGAAAGYSYTNGTNIYTINGVSLVDARTLGLDYQISSELNLFNGLKDYSNLKSALEKRTAARLSLDWAKQQIALDVTQSYLQVVLDQQIITIAQKNLQASQARLRLLQGQAETGVASTADLFRQEAQKSSDEIFQVNSENKFRTDLLTLVQKLRLDPAAEYKITEPPLDPVKPYLADQPEEDLIRQALEKRPDFKSSTSTWNASRWDVHVAQSDYYPKLNLDFVYGATGRYLKSQFLNGQNVLPSSQTPLLSQMGQQTQYVVSLNLSWNIFDHFTTRLGVDRAKVNSDSLRLDSEDLRLTVIREIRQARADFAAALRQLASAKVGVNSAAKANETIAGRYRVGASSFIDLLASQSALVQAQAAQAQAQISLKLQEKLLEYYSGRVTLD